MTNTMTQQRRSFGMFFRGWSLLVALAVTTCGCATYHIGNQSLYPTDIKTVYLPMIQSVSFRRDLGERLTEALVKEIELRTNYKVVCDPHADSILTVRITNDSKHVLVPANTGDARESQASIHVEVSWVDRRGAELRPQRDLPLPSEITDVTGTANLLPEVGQTVATAQQQAICRVAQQIVGAMEKPW
jgi:hypothetical protein